MYKILANTIFLGKDVHFLPECHSTNDKALELIRNGLAREGSIVITEKQTRGKGQRGNSWESEPALNLTFSLILSPMFLDLSEQFFLNMMVSNSIRKFLTEYFPGIEVKWPNDLVVPEVGKIGGVLIENIVGSKGWEYSVVGIGLNINQTHFSAPGATSLAKLTGGKYDLKEMFRLLVTHLEQGYIGLKKGRTEDISREYHFHLYLSQIWAQYRTEFEQFEGKIVGVKEDGKLQIELRNGTILNFGLKELSFPAI